MNRSLFRSALLVLSLLFVLKFPLHSKGEEPPITREEFELRVMTLIGQGDDKGLRALVKGYEEPIRLLVDTCYRRIAEGGELNDVYYLVARKLVEASPDRLSDLQKRYDHDKRRLVKRPDAGKEVVEPYVAGARHQIRFLETVRDFNGSNDDYFQVREFARSHIPGGVGLLESMDNLVFPAEIARDSSLSRGLLFLAYFLEQAQPGCGAGPALLKLRKQFKDIAAPVPTEAAGFYEFQARLNDLLLAGKTVVPLDLVKNNLTHCNHLLVSVFRQYAIRVPSADLERPAVGLERVQLDEAGVELLLSLAESYAQAGGRLSAASAFKEQVKTERLVSEAYRALRERDPDDATGIVVVEVFAESPLAGVVRPGEIVISYAGRRIRSFQELAELEKTHSADRESLAAIVLDPGVGKQREVRLKPGVLNAAFRLPRLAIRSARDGGSVLLVICDVLPQTRNDLVDLLRSYKTFTFLFPNKETAIERSHEALELAATFAEVADDPYIATFRQRVETAAMTQSFFSEMLMPALWAGLTEDPDVQGMIRKYPEHAAATWEQILLPFFRPSVREGTPEYERQAKALLCLSKLLAEVNKETAYQNWAQQYLGLDTAQRTELRAAVKLIVEASEMTDDIIMSQPRLAKVDEAFAGKAPLPLLIPVRLVRARAFWMRHMFAEARNTFEEAARLPALQLLPQMHLNYLEEHCNFLEATGQSSQADLVFKELLGLSERLHGGQEEAHVWNLLLGARLALRLRDMERAEKHLRVALFLSRTYDYPVLLARSLTELGVVEEMRGKLPEALTLVEEAERIYPQLMKHSRGGIGLGTKLTFETIYGTDADSHQIGLIEGAREETALLYARVLEQMGKPDDGWEKLRETGRIRGEWFNYNLPANARWPNTSPDGTNNFSVQAGNFALRTNRLKDAFFEFYHVLLRSGTDTSSLNYQEMLDGLVGLGRYYRVQNDPGTALWCQLQAISLIEERRGELLGSAVGDSSRSLFLQDRLLPYREALELLVDLHRAGRPFEAVQPPRDKEIDPKRITALKQLIPEMHVSQLGRDFAEAALGVAELMKARTLFETISAARMESFQSSLPEVVRKSLREAEDEEARLKTELRKAFATGEPEEVARVLTQRRTLDEKRKKVVAHFAAQAPRGAFLLPLGAGQPSYPRLGKGELLLAFQCLPSRVILWKIDQRHRPQLHVIENAGKGKGALYDDLAEYGRLISRVQNTRLRPRGLKRPPTEQEKDCRERTDELARSLFQRLLSPVFQSLPRDTRVIVIPDGPLAGVPVETLLLPAERQDKEAAVYVDEAFAISYGSSIRLLTLERATPGMPVANRRGTLLIGDPIYQPDDERLAGLKQIHASEWVEAVHGAEAGRKQTPWGRLAGAGQEVDAIGRLCGERNLPVRQAVGLKASEAAVKGVPFSEYRFVHFATHGTLGRSLPYVVEPALVLSLYTSQESREDGYLTLSEVACLDFKGVELVALSACQTGSGAEIQGEGVLSLGRVFQAAGARGLVVSAWPVADRSTAELMEAFYKGLFDNTAPAEALRAARKRIRALDNGRYADPFFWGPFIYLGG